MAKVEKKGTVSEDLLREFFREMLLIRRFEEKVEERFRAGELPASSMSRSGRRPAPSASAARWKKAT